MTPEGRKPTGPNALRRRAYWAFLRGRIASGWLELLLALAIVGGAGLVVQDAGPVLVPAFVLLALTCALTLCGARWTRGVLPGLLLGVVPLGCSLSAARLGHVCWNGGCASLCVPLCAAGGVVAGLLLARAARSTRHPLALWLAGGSIVLATGSLGCACVGVGGLGGMLAGFLPSAALLALPRRA